MPNYDWKCRECGYAFERNRPADQLWTVCPKCEVMDTTSIADRLPPAPAFKVQGGTPRFHK